MRQKADLCPRERKVGKGLLYQNNIAYSEIN